MSLENALISTLRSDATLLALVGEMKSPAGVAAIGHSQILGGIDGDYILIHSGPDDPTYAFGLGEVFSDTTLIIMSYTQDSSESSAQATADAIQSRLYQLLHNQNITVSGRRIMCAKRGSRNHYAFETINSENETFFLAGYQWFFTTSPA